MSHNLRRRVRQGAVYQMVTHLWTEYILIEATTAIAASVPSVTSVVTRAADRVVISASSARLVGSWLQENVIRSAPKDSTSRSLAV